MAMHEVLGSASEEEPPHGFEFHALRWSSPTPHPVASIAREAGRINTNNRWGGKPWWAWRRQSLWSWGSRPGRSRQ